MRGKKMGKEMLLLSSAWYMGKGGMRTHMKRSQLTRADSRWESCLKVLRREKSVRLMGSFLAMSSGEPCSVDGIVRVLAVASSAA